MFVKRLVGDPVWSVFSLTAVLAVIIAFATGLPIVFAMGIVISAVVAVLVTTRRKRVPPAGEQDRRK